MPEEIHVVLYAGRSVVLSVQPHELVSSIMLRVFGWIETQPDLRQQLAGFAESRAVLMHVGPLRLSKALFEQGVFNGAALALVRRRTPEEPVQLWPDDACRNCGEYPTDGARFKRCATCRASRVAVRYCSKDCQIAHWPIHKLRCCGR